MDVNNSALLLYMVTYARWLVGTILLVAGATKAHNIAEFAVTIQLFRLLPRQLSRVSAVLIVCLEVVFGTCLLIGLGVGWTSIGAAALFGLFTLAILVNLIRHNLIHCHCFGPYFKEQISAKTLLRSILLLGCSIIVWQLEDGFLTLETWLSGSTIRYSASLGAFFLLTAILLAGSAGLMSLRMTLRSFQRAKRDAMRESSQPTVDL